ncbi:IclR family transcriptional regulator [Desulfospira joergensenii]|uniref:IclR family transcriptional regulator n=1 Tax=Desulfospira joergensenii TaxID=53329 RepID=UPI0003B2FBAB|nr:IclR family transcriptional regulator [Desulfospira joergensenii]
MPDKDHIKSIEKCFTVLDCLDRAETLLTLEEIVQKTGYKKTTCFRLIKTMMALGLVETAPGTKTYQFGTRLVSLGLSALKNMNLHTYAMPILKRLNDETGETINLTILNGTEILYVERIMSDYLVNINVNIGDRLPVYCASMGKAILAFLPPPRLEQILKQIEYQPKTDRTLLSREALLKELKEIRGRGFAINDEELELGLRAVASPVFNYAGEAFAAVNIAWTTARRPERKAFSEFSGKIISAAREISRLMGYTP